MVKFFRECNEDHWLTVAAFLGSEQRERNGFSAMAGARHELHFRWGSKANQQVIRAPVAFAWLPFSFSIRSYVLKEVVGPRQKSRAAEKEVGNFTTISTTMVYAALKIKQRLTEWQNHQFISSVRQNCWDFATDRCFHLWTMACLSLPDVSSRL